MNVLCVISGIALGCSIASFANAQVVNGDFSSGNSGFTSGHTYSTANAPGAGYYGINTSPKLFNSGGSAFGDHTTGTGLMLLVDASTTANINAWAQTIALTPNTNYHFSAFAASWGQLGNGIDPSPANLVFFRDGVQMGSQAIPTQNGQWVNFGVDFNSGASTSSIFTIRDTNTVFVGNDFALDDLSLAILPEPNCAVLAVPLVLTLIRRRRQLL